MPETKETRVTCLEEQDASQTALKRGKEVKTRATLREIRSRPSTKCKGVSPRAIPFLTKSSTHARKSVKSNSSI